MGMKQLRQLIAAAIAARKQDWASHPSIDHGAGQRGRARLA